MLRWMLGERDVERRTFPALRRIVYGAAPIPPELLTRALRVFDCGFVQGYGLTETTGALTVLRPEDHAPGVSPERLASAGRPLDCCEVRVVDEHGGDVRSGRAGTDGPVGEVVARGANVFAGYWNLPDANAEAFRDGWFHTGDLARIDADGYLTLVDRKKDMLVVGGENVYPREVEDALLAHPDVADAAVIGAPHDVWGEEVLALVVVPPGCAPPRAFDRILIHHCRERLAVFKCPTRVELRDALPRNAAGKLDKKALREPYWAGRSRRI
jgi:acyl-CoA synthetase (AMP-forming)/AMP-acid ligase II